MPKSKRSAKRRAKLKKRGDKTYGWAARKVEQLDPETLQKFIEAQEAVAAFQQAEHEAEIEHMEERIENDVQG